MEKEEKEAHQETQVKIKRQDKRAMSRNIKYMPIETFVQEGYLQEVNRRFLHPLGLALEVRCKEVVQDGTDTVLKSVYEISGVWDYRSDEEGINYATITDENIRKAKNIEDIENQRRSLREKGLGYWIQPIEKEENEEV